MKKIVIDCETLSNRVDSLFCFMFDPEMTSLIHQLWQDPIILKVMDLSSEFYLSDSASYFFDEALRIGEQDYVPTETDVLCARQKSTGITETHFNIGQLSIHMFDVGSQPLERKKWINCFERIIFCTALSKYNQVLLEESMAESLVVFESVTNSCWFLCMSKILLRNKIDIFKSKLLKVCLCHFIGPLEKYFSEYTARPDINQQGCKVYLMVFHAS
ncbi:hypothetical protein PILCRDRAFT_797459 [Piloderma croceum F 1598]|uniref:Uncharacterized protein n=1 Tax=Piloderma croceum (strain F 1598) TaxID=765440 RepID=A0A0C3F985_PILCF|nr:hypothetical protein PILCRDRAFT_797459 [Piloderma croceum F 1598]